MKTDYISREDIKKVKLMFYKAYRKDNNEERLAALIEIGAALNQIPAADVRPVIPAQWIALDIYRNEGNYKCSHCEHPCYVPECMGEPMYAVCPNCGADMREEQHG